MLEELPPMGHALCSIGLPWTSDGYGPGGGINHRVVLVVYRYEPAWVGEFRGFNVINDISIFVGITLFPRTGMLHG
jgi:hypothetical protein